MDNVLAYLKQHEADHVSMIQDLCRFPTISTLSDHSQHLHDAAKWLHSTLEGIGLKTQTLPTPGYPVVFAEYEAGPDKPTYLVYGHYDVQPTGDLKLWDADPFDPVINNDWLICRGSADDKGQALIYLQAVAAWLKTDGKLPINLKIMIEGEEEIGSPNLTDFVKQHRDLLKCDGILISDTGMLADGFPTLTYGTRGLLYKEVLLTGPVHDLHSGSFGGTIPNPANELARLIARMHDTDGRVTLPGFYDRVQPLGDDERADFAALPFDEAQYLKDLNVAAPAGEAGYTTLERRSVRPTLDVNGIVGGFIGEGANTIIPSKASAKISMRLVPDQTADELSDIFDRWIADNLHPGVRHEILNHGTADAYVTPRSWSALGAAKTSLREAFDHDVALIREGGSLPILPMFKEVLGADSLMLGFAGPHCNAHGPNEKLGLKDLHRGTNAVARLFAKLADA